MATWTKADRGLGIGLLVGALTLGSAAPHLLNALGGAGAWQSVLYVAAGLAILGGLIALIFASEGPYRSPAPRFNWRYIGEQPNVRTFVAGSRAGKVGPGPCAWAETDCGERSEREACASREGAELEHRARNLRIRSAQGGA